MRWLLLWLLLTTIQAVGWLASGLPVSAEGAEGLVHLAVIPPVQTLALAVVARVRRRAGVPPPPSEE